MSAISIRETNEAVNENNLRKSIKANTELLKRIFPDKAEEIYKFESEYRKETDDEIALNAFIGFLDIHFLNQISSLGYSKDFAIRRLNSNYGREKNHTNLIDQVLLGGNRSMFLNWSSRANILDFSVLRNYPIDKYNIVFIDENDLESIYDKVDKSKENIFVINGELTKEFIDKLKSINLPEKTFITGKIKFAENLYGEFFMSGTCIEKNGEKDYYVPNKFFDTIIRGEGRKFPIVFPDIQSVIKQRILLGISIYGIDVNAEVFDDVINETCGRVNDTISKSRLLKTRRIAATAKEGDIERFKKRHIEHYKNFFQEESMGVPDVVLCNSGVSANDSIIAKLEGIEPDYRRWAVQDFYYENIINNSLQNETGDKTRVLLISPSILDPKRGKNKDKKQRETKKSVEQIMQNAISNPNETFYLVIDVTTNLTLDIADFYSGVIPKNLVVVKTYSATKHQRGGVNYFMGGLAIYGQSDLANDLQKVVEEKGYSLTREQVISYPRVTRNEINGNIENIERNRKAFNQGFYSYFVENKIPNILIPEVIDSEYFSFIIPPIPEICYWIDNGNLPKNRVESMDGILSLKSFRMGKKGKIPFVGSSECILSFLSPDAVEIEPIDSFGFKRSTVIFYGKNIPSIFGGEINTDLKFIEIPRISFGINYDYGDSINLGRQVAREYHRFLVIIFKNYIGFFKKFRKSLYRRFKNLFKN